MPDGRSEDQERREDSERVEAPDVEVENVEREIPLQVEGHEQIVALEEQELVFAVRIFEEELEAAGLEEPFAGGRWTRGGRGPRANQTLPDAVRRFRQRPQLQAPEPKAR
jgi:hypothetical protein